MHVNVKVVCNIKLRDQGHYWQQ